MSDFSISGFIKMINEKDLIISEKESQIKNLNTELQLLKEKNKEYELKIIEINNEIEKNNNNNFKSKQTLIEKNIPIMNYEKQIFKQKLNKKLKNNESLIFEIIIGEKIMIWEQKNYSIEENTIFYINLFQNYNQYFTIKFFQSELYIKLGDYNNERIIVYSEKEMNDYYYFKIDENDKLIQYKVNNKNKFLKIKLLFVDFIDRNISDFDKQLNENKNNVFLNDFIEKAKNEMNEKNEKISEKNKDIIKDSNENENDKLKNNESFNKQKEIVENKWKNYKGKNKKKNWGEIMDSDDNYSDDEKEKDKRG